MQSACQNDAARSEGHSANALNRCFREIYGFSPFSNYWFQDMTSSDSGV